MPTPLELAIARITIPELGKMFYPEWRPESHPCHCPDRADKQPSFNVYNDGRRFHDFASGEDGDVVSFLARIKRISNADACSELIRLTGIGRGNNNPVAPVPAPARQPPDSNARGQSRDCRSLTKERPLSITGLRSCGIWTQKQLLSPSSKGSYDSSILVRGGAGSLRMSTAGRPRPVA